MDEMWKILLSWQFLLMGMVVFIIIAFFNGLGSWRGIGSFLWTIENRTLRKLLKVTEMVKIPCMFLLGFGLAWIPGIPRPSEFEEASTLSLALLYGIAGLFSMIIVKWVKKVAEARGIDIELNLDPKEQKKAKGL
jgi:hypothetical protein